MRLLRALAGFLVDATRNLRRGPQASLLAIGSIAVSLLVVGFFHLVGRNLAERAERLGAEARILVYARDEAPAAALDRLEARLRALDWVDAVRRVTPQEALAQLRSSAPDLVDRVTGAATVTPPAAGRSAEAAPPALPTSFEVRRRAGAADRADRRAELEALDPAVWLVDDDREWLEPLESAATALRVLALALVAVLLGASLLTIGAVIRLKALLDQDEIAVLRLVGGTEFSIRGPFYAEGLLLGAIGGALALGLLRIAAWVVAGRLGAWPLVASLVGDFLPWRDAAGLVALGAAAGLAGAVLSLRREATGPGPDAP